MSDFTQDLIHIAVGHLLPANPKKYAWVSAVETGPYHIETNDSAANGGQGFKAICGAAGDFNFHLTGAQIFPSQKCKTCVESSTGNILDVAGVPHSQGLLPGTAAGKDSGVGPLANPQVTAKGIPGYLPSSPNRPAGILDVVDLAAGNAPVKDSPLVGNEGVSSAQANPQGSSDSQINQGLTIERLIHAVVMAEEHAEEIEQLRAEENDAAEEGALIDASGYNDPASDRSFA